jgi:type II secretory pathway pseudopilin PulG
MPSSQGFTFAEIIIALLILGFVTTSILGIFLQSMNVEAKDRTKTEVSLIASCYMEELKKGLISGSDFDLLQSSGFKNLPENSDYVYEVRVSTVSPSTSSIKQVTIAFYYKDSDNPTPGPDFGKPMAGRIYQLGTLILRP